MNSHRPFTFELPTRISFGVGAVTTLPDEIRAVGGTSVLLVSDPGLVAAGVVDRVAALLRKEGLEPAIFTEVEPEPDAKGVMAAAELARSSSADVVAAIPPSSAVTAPAMARPAALS